MPDYDAGTARAHIRVDGDSRGADGATRAVQGFQRALEFIASHMGGFVAAMDKMESELNHVQGDFKDAANAAEKYDRAIDGISATQLKASRATSDFGKNIQDLHGRLKFAHDAMADYGVPIIQAARAMREFNNTRGGFIGTIQAVSRAGIAGAALAAIKSHLLGMGLALRQAPLWQQSLARFAQNVGLVTLAGGKLGKIIAPLSLGFSKLVKDAEGADFAIAGFERVLQKTIGTTSNFFNTLDKIPDGLFKVVGGMALARSGMQGLAQRWSVLSTVFGQGGGRLGQILRFVLLPGIILSGAATQAFDKSLIALSNTFAGLWSGIKQLSGGLLSIPGAIAMVVAAAGPLAIIAKTLKSNFKDLISAVNANDPEKFAQAMQKIPPYLRPLAQAVANAIGPLKSLGDVLTATFVSGGLDQQFASLVNTWLPAISTGADQVANSWKILANQFASFLGEAQTISGVNTIFMHTAETMNAIGGAIKPIGDGLRDIAVVGSTFWRNLAQDYLPQIADKFGKWATNAAASGKAMAWMEGSVHAVKELWIILDQTTKGLWRLLTLFQTKPGETWLDRVAADMTKFNNAIQKSAASGELKKIADSVKGVGTDKLKELWHLFLDLLPAVRAVLQTLSQMGTAFGNVLLPTIQLITSALVPLVQALNSLGIGTALGTILGLTKAFGLLKGVIGTGLDFAKIFAGLSFIKSGYASVLLGLATTLDKFGPAGQRASAGLLSFTDRINGLVGKVALIGAAVLGAIFAFEQYDNKVSATNKVMDDSRQHTLAFRDALNKAFVDDKGISGDNVTTTIRNQIATMMSDLENQSNRMPGIMDHIIGFFKTAGGMSEGGFDVGLNPFKDPKAINDAQAMAQSARDAQAEFKKLSDAGVDLTSVIQSDDETFSKFYNSLEQGGAQGQAAAQVLLGMRNTFKELKDNAEAAGPGMLELQAGIAKIGSSAGDTNTKLDGLKMALQGLGLLKEDAYEAALNFAKAIDDLGNAAANAADKSQPLENLLDPNTGILNTAAGVNARNLYNAVQPLAEAFLHAAASGQDLGAFVPKMNDNLEQLRQSFGLSKEAFDKFIQGLGIDPPTVSLLVQAKDDKVEQGIIEIAARARESIGNQAPIQLPVGVDASKVADAVNKLFNNPNAVGVKGQNIVLAPGIDQSAVDKIQQYLASKYGIQMGPNAPPIDPTVAATMPTLPTAPGQAPVVPAPGTPPEAKQPKGGPTTPLPPGTYLPPSLQAAAAPPTSPSDLLQSTLKAAGPAPAPAPAPAAAAAAPAPPAGVPQQVNIPVQVSGMDQLDELQGKIKGLNDSLAQNVAQWLAWSAGVMGALTQTEDNVKTILDSIAEQASAAGKKFSEDFAAGITDPGALQRISDAAIAAMQQASNKLPHSPAKEGPLSGQGWSGHAGGALASDFATGILGGQAAVGDAANKLAGKVAGALKPATPYGLFGFKEKDPEPFKQLSDILKLASDGVGLFKDVSDQVFKVIDFAQNPLGTNKTDTTGAAAGASIGAGTPPAGSPLAQVYSLAKGASGGKYSFGASNLQQSLADCSGAVSDLTAALTGQPLGKRLFDTNNEASVLKSLGFTPGNVPGQFNIGILQGGPGGGHTAATLPNGVNFEAGGSHGGILLGGAAAGAGASEFTDHWTIAVDPQTGRPISGITPPGQNPNITGQPNPLVPPQAGAKPGEKAQPAAGTEGLAAGLGTKDIHQQGQLTPEDQAKQDALAGSQDQTGGQAQTVQDSSQNVVGQISSAVGSASNVASSIIQTVQAGLDAWGATKYIMDQMVRGISDTEDIFNLVDQFQKYITFAADIANSAGQILSLAGSGAGADPSGASAAIAAAGQVAQMISAALTTVNAVIDFGQEAYRIFGTYFGQFLSFLTGGAAGLMGDVHFLLDQNTHQLLAYSGDNALKKVAHSELGQNPNLAANNQLIGQLNYYAGPGEDPRDGTRNMMYQVRASQMNTVTAQ